MISKDNKMQIESGSNEEKVYGYNTGNKPVTALKEYDQILFFDDNRTEGEYLKKLYRDEENSPEKQVIFARYRYDPLKPYQIYGYMKISEENKVVAEKVNKLFTKLLEEPGCELMIEKIDIFQNSSFVKGLTIVDDIEVFNKHRHDISDIEDEIEDMLDEDSELEKRYQDYMGKYFTLIDTTEINPLENEK